MKEKFLRFMQGRYGVDQFSKGLLIAGLVIVLLSSLFAGGKAGSLFYLLGWILIIYCYFRIFSKNVSKRYAENQKYLAKTYKIRTYIQQQKNSLAQRKAYHIYKCPGCKQKIRIPKGKERLRSDARSVEQHLLRRVDVFTGDEQSVMIFKCCWSHIV